MGVCNCFMFCCTFLMSILEMQSSWWGRESWLLCLICLPGVLWWLSGSSSRCHGVVCSLWLRYFLIILTYYFWHHWIKARHACSDFQKNWMEKNTCLSHDLKFPTMWYVGPAKVKISLRIRAVWSEPLLVACLRLLTKHYLEFISLKGGCTSSSESTHVKLPHCWKWHVAAHIGNT